MGYRYFPVGPLFKQAAAIAADQARPYRTAADD